MAQSIYKYQLGVGVVNEIEVPAGARNLAVMEQRGAICLWMQVDTNAEKEVRRYHVVGTGWRLDEGFAEHAYVGSCQVGPFVWHAFEEVL